MRAAVVNGAVKQGAECEGEGGCAGSGEAGADYKEGSVGLGKRGGLAHCESEELGYDLGLLLVWRKGLRCMILDEQVRF